MHIFTSVWPPNSLLLRVVHSLTAPANHYSHKSMALVIGSMSRSRTCIHTLLLHSHSNSHPLSTGTYNVPPPRVQATGVRKPTWAQLGVWIGPGSRSNTTWDGVATYHDTDSHNSSILDSKMSHFPHPLDFFASPKTISITVSILWNIANNWALIDSNDLFHTFLILICPLC